MSDSEESSEEMMMPVVKHRKQPREKKPLIKSVSCAQPVTSSPTKPIAPPHAPPAKNRPTLPSNVISNLPRAPNPPSESPQTSNPSSFSPRGNPPPFVSPRAPPPRFSTRSKSDAQKPQEEEKKDARSATVSMLQPKAKKEKESKKKSSSSSSKERNSANSEQLEQLRKQNERLRGLVTSLTSRLELLEIHQHKMNEITDELKTIKETLQDSSTTTKKDRNDNRSSLAPVLQNGPTSNASDILDLIENDKAIYYSGWMNKKGRKVRNWKRRWFVLKGHHLCYFAKENDKTPLGEINLETCMVDELKEREESQRKCMALLVEGRKLLFTADEPEENKKWYLYLVCKNSELSYLRKLKHISQLADNTLLQFLEQPMTNELRMNNTNLSIDSVVALTSPLRNHDTLRYLSLRYCKLNDLSVSTLCESLKFNNSIEVIDLEGNTITADGAKAISNVVAANTNLRELILSENQIGDKGLSLISQVLESNMPNLKLAKIDLTNNQIGASGAAAFARALEKLTNMPEIFLDDNQIGDNGLDSLFEMCQKNSNVFILRLQNNQISDEGVFKISEKLQQNSSLKRLYLSFNTITNNSYQTMVRNLMINRSLEFIEFADYRLEASDLCSLRLLNDCNLLRLD